MVELDHDLSRRNYRPSYSFRRVANRLACAVAVDNGPAHRQERIGRLPVYRHMGVDPSLRIESHGKQCRLTITPMGRTALALGSKEKPVE